MNRNNFFQKRKTGVTALICFLSLPAGAWSAPDLGEMTAASPVQEMIVGAGKSSVLDFSTPIERVSVNDEAIADVVVISPNQVLVLGKQPGSTSVVVWQSGRQKLYEIKVQPVVPVQGKFDELLKKIMPGEDQLSAFESDKTIVIAGKAKHPANLAKAVQAAAASAEKVVNVADVLDTKQVLLEVRLAEVDRTLGKALGIDYLVQSSDFTHSSFVGGSLAPQTPATPQFARVVDPKDILLSPVLKQLFEFRNGGMDLSVALNALEEKGMVRILAEPNLLATSGEKASFLAGGEFPIPIVQGASGGNSVTIQFKEFGVKLNFKPDVTSEDSIRLFVEPEVSVLDFGKAALKIGGFQIPALLTRRASTTVEMRSGESLAIGGLLSQNHSMTEESVPFLGDIPVLGKLFSSEKFKNDQSELLVLVTPRLIQPHAVDLPVRYPEPKRIGELFQRPAQAAQDEEWDKRLDRAMGGSDEK